MNTVNPAPLCISECLLSDKHSTTEQFEATTTYLAPESVDCLGGSAGPGGLSQFQLGPCVWGLVVLVVVRLSSRKAGATGEVSLGIQQAGLACGHAAATGFPGEARE